MCSGPNLGCIQFSSFEFNVICIAHLTLYIANKQFDRNIYTQDINSTFYIQIISYVVLLSEAFSAQLQANYSIKLAELVKSCAISHNFLMFCITQGCITLFHSQQTQTNI